MAHWLNGRARAKTRTTRFAALAQDAQIRRQHQRLARMPAGLRRPAPGRTSGGMTPTIRTLSERKAAAAAAKATALDRLRPALADAARELGGRFLLYGSAAQGRLRHDSDIDLLLDFPDDAATTAAWDAAERECAGLGLESDARPLAWCGAGFLQHVLPGAVPLG